MSTEELRAKWQEASLAPEKAKNEAEELRLVEEADRAEAAYREALEARGKLLGARLKRANKSADKAVQFDSYDARSTLFQLADDEFPAGGVFLFRSPSVETQRRYQAATSALDVTPDKSAEALIDVIVACTVHPETKGDMGMEYRAFWETLARGQIQNATTVIFALGGASVKAFLRAAK